MGLAGTPFETLWLTSRKQDEEPRERASVVMAPCERANLVKQGQDSKRRLAYASASMRMQAQASVAGVRTRRQHRRQADNFLSS